MDETPKALDPELLLSHRPFVRALARSLVRDESRADDVVQETFAVALTRPPRSVASLRGWLARVARNFAYKTAREEGRRARREKAVARPEGTPSAGDLVARLAMHRQVVDAVLTLDEPFRGAVLLRYYEELSPAEIAERTGVTESTVRTRLHRARAKLRGLLDDAHGGRRDVWKAGLLPLAFGSERSLPKTAAGGAAGLLGGALLVKKLAAGFALAVVVAALGLFLFSEGDAPPPHRDDPAEEVATAPVSGADPDPDRAEERPEGRSVLLGTVLRSGHPVAAHIEVRRVGRVARPGVIGPAFGRRQLHARLTSARGPASAEGSAGDDGRFEIGALPAGRYEVRAVGAGGVTGSAIATIPMDGVRVDVRVALFGGAENLAGRAVFADGMPGVPVRAWDDTLRDEQVWRPDLCAAVTDADGAFRIEDLVPGVLYRFRASASWRGLPESGILVPEPGETLDVELRTEATRRLVVRVVDDRTGEPVPGVLVSVGSGAANVTLDTAPDGTAVFDRASASPLPVSADHEDFVPANVTTVPAGSEDLTVEIRRRMGGGLAGRVRFREAGPVRSGHVRAKWRAPDRDRYVLGRLSGDGTFRLRGLPNGVLELEVDVDYGMTGWTVPAGMARAGEEELDVVLDHPAVETAAEETLEVRVLDPDGEPVPRARLWWALFAATSSRSSGAWEPVRNGRARCTVYGDTSEVYLVAGGAESVPGRPLALGCAVVGPLSGKTREVEVRLPPEKAISGVVRGPDGRAVRGVRIMARVTGAGGRFARPVSTARCGADGTFHLRGLGDGEYELTVAAPPDLLPPEPRMVAGGTTGLSIDLRRGVSPVLRFLDDEGRPLAGASVGVTEAGSRWAGVDFTRADARGRARLRQLDPEKRYQLRPTAPWERRSIRLVPITDWVPADATFRFERERHISGTVVDEAGEPVAGARVRIRMGDHTKGTAPATGPDGAFEIRQLPSGEAELRVLPPGAHRREWEAPWMRVVTGSRDVVLVTSLGAAVSGRVPDWPGDDRRVTLARLDHEKAKSFHRTLPIAADGSFRFTGLPEGARYALWIPPDGEGRSGLLREVRAGDAEVRIELVPGNSVTGRLKIPEGALYPSVRASRLDLGIVVAGEVEKDGRYVVRGLPDLEYEIDASVAKAGKFLNGAARARAGASVDVVIAE